MTREVDNLALIGFMGSGKSSVGPLLASRLGMRFVELDKAVEACAGMSIEDIFTRGGEGAFRRLESEALAGELEGSGKVVACGGGVVLREVNTELLRKKCRVYLLLITPETAMRRLQDPQGRPLLKGPEPEKNIARLMDERARKYAAAAHESVAADEGSPEEIAEEIAGRWRRYKCGRRGAYIPST